MVQHLVGVALAFVELLEAEAAKLKLNVRKVLVTGALAIAGALVAATLLSAASGLLLWSAFLALRPAVGQAPAALIVGLGVWVLIGGASWIVVNRLKRS